jgi:outer membrane protein assembly factor BamB
MCLSGDLILAVDCEPDDPIGERQGLFTGRNVKTGAEVFRVRLPPGYENPRAIQEVTGLFLVQLREARGGKGNGVLIDRTGQVRHKFDRQVITGKLVGMDRVFLTSRDVVCRAPDDKTRWAVPFSYSESIAGGDILDVGGGNLVAYLYGRISDSGVYVVRLDPVTGQEVWQTHCSWLGVDHSEYYHEATVRVDGDHLKVTSWGSSGWFVELLDPRTGNRLGRRVLDRTRSW